MVEVNTPSPQAGSPKPDNPLENMNQVESDWDEDLESVDYRARTPNDKRKPKTLMRKNLNIRGMPSCWPRNMREKYLTPCTVQNTYQWLHPLDQTK